jgi:hypothetical protein
MMLKFVLNVERHYTLQEKASNDAELKTDVMVLEEVVSLTEEWKTSVLGFREEAQSLA